MSAGGGRADKGTHVSSVSILPIKEMFFKAIILLWTIIDSIILKENEEICGGYHSISLDEILRRLYLDSTVNL